MRKKKTIFMYLILVAYIFTVSEIVGPLKPLKSPPGREEQGTECWLDIQISQNEITPNSRSSSSFFLCKKIDLFF